ncbi:uncharacterized mitochondrial protein AtMg00810-like [Syzygium oleosum]|uniref:uncharacterized mitochondrial protein AtMg00810-like n=1 Tax=Syzygium oleosum TaxID=219896 RepID=UPI0024BBBA78|nr:uncharacterized mitochondrial protein AtMg00810-like [Syzygium oleosum]
MEVQHTSTGLLLNQAKFTQEILQRSKMTEARVAPTSCTTDEPLSAQSGDPMPDPILYRSIVGALQYLTLTHPDISYSVNTACQFLHAPTIIVGKLSSGSRAILLTLHGTGYTSSACHPQLSMHSPTPAGPMTETTDVPLVASASILVPTLFLGVLTNNEQLLALAQKQNTKA